MSAETYTPRNYRYVCMSGCVSGDTYIYVCMSGETYIPRN